MNNKKTTNSEKCYYGIHIPEAVEIIERDSRAALIEKYGDKPDEKIIERYNKELEMIKEWNAGCYYIAYLIARKCDELGFVHSLRGCGGSSFIAYLLGITEVNPLPPHYYCSSLSCYCCSHVEFVDDNVFLSGFDLGKDEKECPKYAWKKFTGDGQDSPWEFFLGLEGDKQPDFDFNVPSRKEIFAYLAEEFGKDWVFNVGQINNGNIDVHPGKIIIIPEDLDIHDFAEVVQVEDAGDITYQEPVALLDDYYMFDHIDVFQNEVLRFIGQMEKRTGIPADSINLRGSEIMDLLEYEDIEGFPFNQEYKETLKRIIDIAKPRCYSDLLKIYGNIHGTGVWEDNNEILLSSGFALHDTIAFREDVMLSLLRCGVNYGDAFKLAESVRLGRINRRGFSEKEIEILQNSDVPEWYIHSLEKIKYLFPKVHAVEYMTMYVRAIWYKKHYKDENLTNNPFMDKLKELTKNYYACSIFFPCSENASNTENINVLKNLKEQLLERCNEELSIETYAFKWQEGDSIKEEGFIVVPHLCKELLLNLYFAKERHGLYRDFPTTGFLYKYGREYEEFGLFCKKVSVFDKFKKLGDISPELYYINEAEIDNAQSKISYSKITHSENDYYESDKYNVKIVGMGGAGRNILIESAKRESFSTEYICCDSTPNGLHLIMCDRFIQLGKKTCKGLGAGANPEIGRMAAEESIHEIIECLENTDLIIIIAGMGGGIGTGAAPVIAKAAREKGAHVIGVVTIPFFFEGSKRMLRAKEGIDTLNELVDRLIVVYDDSVLPEQLRDISMLKSFEMVDVKVADIIHDIMIELNEAESSEELTARSRKGKT